MYKRIGEALYRPYIFTLIVLYRPYILLSGVATTESNLILSVYADMLSMGIYNEGTVTNPGIVKRDGGAGILH